jgi:thioredoxin 1
MGPVFEKLSNEINYVNFAKVDVDQHRDLALHYQVQSIPTIILFKDGKIVDKFTGFLPKEEILKFINQHVK